MSNPTKTNTHKKAMIEALQKSLGIVTQACKMVGIDRWTHYDWYNNDPEYKKKVDDVAEITIDFAESQLHKQIKEQNTTATIFFLKTKAKHRGYIERQEITGADGSPSAFTVVVTNNATQSK
jgi:hypothetical protein